MNRLKSKVAMITGSGGGIGAAMARLFAREGASVVVNDIARERAEAVAEEIRRAGGTAEAILADISSGAEVDRLFSRTRERFGGLDILVNNAITAAGDTNLVDLEEEVFDRTIAVCLKGPYLCTRRAIPMMRERGGGSIVTMSSVNALYGVGESAYTAAKGGLISLMRLVAAEFGHWGIRSNLICPGTISTEYCMAYWRQFPEGFEKLVSMYPLGRIGTPEEVARYALFLASDDASFVSGSVCVVDGGLLSGHKFEV